MPVQPEVRTLLVPLARELFLPRQLAEGGTIYEHPEWGRGTVVRRYDNKLEIEFPTAGRKVFTVNAPILRRIE